MIRACSPTATRRSSWVTRRDPAAACQDVRVRVCRFLWVSLAWLELPDDRRRGAPRSTACTVASETEWTIPRGATRRRGGERHPERPDLSGYAGVFDSSRPNSLIFSGALTSRANDDALRYFLAEAYPPVRRAVPGIRLRGTTDSRAVDLGSLPSPTGVELLASESSMPKRERPSVTRGLVGSSGVATAPPAPLTTFE